MNTYCEIYIGTDLKDKAEVAKQIHSLIGGTLEGCNIETDWSGDLEISRNKTRDIPLLEILSWPTDFLQAPFFIELDHQESPECISKLDLDLYIQKTAEMLTLLKEANIPFVAACEFEDQLPVYKPWPEN